MSMIRMAGAMLATALLLASPLRADDRASPEDARLIVAEAIAYFDTNGLDATVAAINADDAMFHRGDLYVFLWAEDGMVLAHPIDQGLVGQDGKSFTDVDGAAFGREIVRSAGAAGAWVNYKWLDPATGEEEPKSTWVALHNGYIFGAGISAL